MIDRPPTTPPLGPAEQMVGSEIDRVMSADQAALTGLKKAAEERRQLAENEAALTEVLASDHVIRSIPDGATLVRSFNTPVDPVDTVPVTRIERAAVYVRRRQAEKLRNLEHEIGRIDSTRSEPVINEDLPDINTMSFSSVEARRAEIDRRKRLEKDAPKVADIGSPEHLLQIETERRPRKWGRHERKNIKIHAKRTAQEHKLKEKMERGKQGDTLHGRHRAAKIDELSDLVASGTTKIDEFDKSEYDLALQDVIKTEREQYGKLHGLEVNRDHEKREKLFQRNAQLRREYTTTTTNIDSAIADIDAVDPDTLSDEDKAISEERRSELVDQRKQAQDHFKAELIKARAASRSEVAKYDTKITAQKDKIAELDAASSNKVRKAQERLGEKWSEDIEHDGTVEERNAESERKAVKAREQEEIAEARRVRDEKIIAAGTEIAEQVTKKRTLEQLKKDIAGISGEGAWMTLDSALRRGDLIDAADMEASQIRQIQQNLFVETAQIHAAANQQIAILEAGFRALEHMPLHTMTPEQRSEHESLVESARSQLETDRADILTGIKNNSLEARRKSKDTTAKLRSAFSDLHDLRS